MTTVLESVATAVGAGIVMGSFVMGTVGMVAGRSRRDLEKRALRDGYVGGAVAAVLLIFDLALRYVV